MNENVSLFDKDVSENQAAVDPLFRTAGRIDVVRMEFAEAQTLSWRELFSGFDRMYAITYSSGIGFIGELLSMFSYSEIIFGFEDVISYSLQEVMAFQLSTIEKLREMLSVHKAELVYRIEEERLRLFVARQKLSHEKVYLLEAADGRKRTILGSANMSRSAFTGVQRENICYIDGEKAFKWYYESFMALKGSSSDSISRQALLSADSNENLDEIPIMQTVRVKKALVLEPQHDVREDVRFVLDVKSLSGQLAAYMPKAEKTGKVLLSPETVIAVKRRIIEANVKEKELRSEYPQLKVDVEDHSVSLNGVRLDLQPDDEMIRKDLILFVKYMDGYEKFHGDIAGMQHRYFEFANWFFVSPFMATMRDMATRYNQNLLPYPVFGLLYGQSKAGKTSFLETLLKMMIGQKTKISAPDFTRSAIEALKRIVLGAPIIVDDLTQQRFSQHAIETIKDDDFGVADRLTNYPAVVISANEDVKAVAAEVIRRTVICRVQAGLKNTELMKSNVVRHVQKSISTAFYREYLRRMLEAVPELLDQLKEDDADGAPDILKVSSETILAIFADHYDDPIPDYIRSLSLEDYFSEKVTGAYARKTIQNAWKINRKAFTVDRKSNQLRYNAGQTWEVDRILKELPEDLEAVKSRDIIIMDLDKSCEFFETDFFRSTIIERISRFGKG